MRKHLVILLALVMVLGFHSGAFADDNDKFNVDGFYIDQDERMSYKPLVKHIITNDTVTAAETGMLILVNSSTTPARLTLPSAQAGLIYTVVDGTGGGFIIKPASGDILNILTLDTNDEIQSPDNAGDSMTVIATGDTIWYVMDYGGTFVDGAQ